MVTAVLVAPDWHREPVNSVLRRCLPAKARARWRVTVTLNFLHFLHFLHFLRFCMSAEARLVGNR